MNILYNERYIKFNYYYFFTSWLQGSGQKYFYNQSIILFGYETSLISETD